MSTPKKILCIDIEATCWEDRPPNKFPDQRNEIIEIGVAEIDIKTRQIERVEGIIVHPPTTEISEFCTRLTTLTPEYVERWGIPIEDAMDVLRKKYHLHRNIFASWGDYDRRSFEKNCKWAGIENPVSNMVLNVKTLFAVKHGYNGGLDACAKDLNIPFVGTHHRGMDDARMVAKILQVLI